MAASKVYFITGATRGIGFQTAKQLSEREPNSLIIGSARSKAPSNLTKLAESSKNVKIVTLDVSSQESIDQLDAQLSQIAPDGIDVFISNAGIAEPITSSRILDLPREAYLKHYVTNTLGPIFVTKVVYPYLQKRPTKLISFTSALVGGVASDFILSTSANGQSKAALNHSIRVLAKELKDEGFTIIAVHPGLVSTDTGNAAFGGMAALNPGFQEIVDAALITPEEGAKAQIELFSKLTKDDTNKFFSYDGSIVSW